MRRCLPRFAACIFALAIRRTCGKKQGMQAARGWRLPLLITFLIVSLFLSCFATPVDIIGSEAKEIAVQSGDTDLLAETEKIVEGTNKLEKSKWRTCGCRSSH